jgi:hypothetical protein
VTQRQRQVQKRLPDARAIWIGSEKAERRAIIVRLLLLGGSVMKTSALRMALGGCAFAVFALAAGTQADAKCWRVSASGVGLTKELAMEFAKMNLDSSIAAKGAKAKGKTHYKCTGPFFAECTARRRACS